MVSNPFFHNRVFAVSGGASGIGLAITRQLLTQCARVAVCDYRIPPSFPPALNHALQSGQLTVTTVDVAKRDDVCSWFEDTIRLWGRLDGAVNCAGVMGKDHNFGQVVKQDDADWNRVFAINVNGTLNCLREQLKYIGKGRIPDFKGREEFIGAGSPRAEGGSIVNVGSMLSVAGTAGTASYTASKHAVLGLTRSVAKEVGPQGTRVNCLCPGPVGTPLLARVAEQELAAGIANQNNEGYGSLALRRIADPDELADAAVYLLSDKSTFITGAVVPVDGGLRL